MESIFELTWSDALRSAIEKLPDGKQKSYFQDIFSMMGNYIQQHDEFLTFGEYMRMY